MLLLRDMDLLLVPSSSGDVSVIQWPPFLLASKVRNHWCLGGTLVFTLVANKDSLIKNTWVINSFVKMHKWLFQLGSFICVFNYICRFPLLWKWQKISREKRMLNYLEKLQVIATCIMLFLRAIKHWRRSSPLYWKMKRIEGKTKPSSPYHLMQPWALPSWLHVYTSLNQGDESGVFRSGHKHREAEIHIWFQDEWITTP